MSRLPTLLPTAKRAQEMALGARESIAVDLFEHAKVAELVRDAAAKGAASVVLLPDRPTLIKVTKAAVEFEAEIKKRGFRTLWIEHRTPASNEVGDALEIGWWMTAAG